MQESSNVLTNILKRNVSQEQKDLAIEAIKSQGNFYSNMEYEDLTTVEKHPYVVGR